MDIRVGEHLSQPYALRPEGETEAWRAVGRGTVPHPPAHGGASAERVLAAAPPPQPSRRSQSSGLRNEEGSGGLSRRQEAGPGVAAPAQTRSGGGLWLRRGGGAASPANNLRRFPWQRSPQRLRETPDPWRFPARALAPPAAATTVPAVLTPFRAAALPPQPRPRPDPTPRGRDPRALPGPRRRPSAAGSAAPGAPWSRGRLNQSAPRPSAAGGGGGRDGPGSLRLRGARD